MLAIEFERTFHHGGRFRRQLVPTQVVRVRKTHLGHVGTGAQSTARGPAQIIHQDEVIHDTTLGIVRDPIDHFNHWSHTYLEPGLFEHFPNQTRFERLADFDRAPRKAPLTSERLVLPLDEKDLAILHDHGTNADERAVRISTPVGHLNVPAHYSPITLMTTRFFR